MANLTNDKGVTLTPEQLAADIMVSLEDQAVMISGTANEDLEFLVQSKNTQIFMARGKKWYDQEKENLKKAFLSETIQSLAKAKRNYLSDKAVADQDSCFRLLRSRGVAPAEAEKIAYPNGVPKPRKAV